MVLLAASATACHCCLHSVTTSLPMTPPPASVVTLPTCNYLIRGQFNCLIIKFAAEVMPLEALPPSLSDKAHGMTYLVLNSLSPLFLLIYYFHTPANPSYLLSSIYYLYQVRVHCEHLRVSAVTM